MFLFFIYSSLQSRQMDTFKQFFVRLAEFVVSFITDVGKDTPCTKLRSLRNSIFAMKIFPFTNTIYSKIMQHLKRFENDKIYTMTGNLV